jgi:hypothetical protein
MTNFEEKEREEVRRNIIFNGGKEIFVFNLRYRSFPGSAARPSGRGMLVTG